MEIVTAILIFGAGFLISYFIYHSFLNLISLYSVIWLNMIIWYEVRLIQFDQISTETYLYIYSAYIIFVLGNVLGKLYLINSIDQKPDFLLNELLSEKLLKSIILPASIIGLITALLNWQQLFELYGSIPNIFLHGQEVYGKRVKGDIIEVIPYINSFIYIAIFFSAIYFSKYIKLNIYVILPFIALFLKEIAAFGRSGILFGLFEFTIIFIFYRIYLKEKKYSHSIFPIKMVFTILIIFVFAVMTATTVKSFRASVESFKGSSRELSQFKNNIVLSPSIYFYMSSHIGVLNKYFEKESEKAQIGENSFLIIYSILAKLKLVDRPSDYQKGYLFPTWSNTGTYLREIHSDFGLSGIIIIPFLLGFFGFISWFKFQRKGYLFSFISLIGISLIVSNSFLIMATRWTYFFIAFVLIYIISFVLVKVKQNIKTAG